MGQVDLKMLMWAAGGAAIGALVGHAVAKKPLEGAIGGGILGAIASKVVPPVVVPPHTLRFEALANGRPVSVPITIDTESYTTPADVSKGRDTTKTLMWPEDIVVDGVTYRFVRKTEV